MDGLSTAASIIAAIQISTEVAKICRQYLLEVKNAKTDIEQLQTQSEIIIKLLNHTQKLLEGPHKARLSTSRELGTALNNCKDELERLQRELQDDFSKQISEREKRRNRVLNRIGLLDFKWPFTKKEVHGIIERLEKIQLSIDRALQLDQIRVVLSVEQEANLAKLLVADGASFGSLEDENEPECLPDTRTEILGNIQKWIADPGVDIESIFWLCGMAGTGKSTISRSVARILRDKGQLGASFFFKRGNAYRGDPSRFFSTLAAELRLFMPQIGPDLSEAVGLDPNIARRALREQFEKLILGPLSRIDHLNIPLTNAVTVIVIDALDECEGEDAVKLILELLMKLQNLDLRIRIFITSRPETAIQLGFGRLPQSRHRDMILHDIQKGTIEHDIYIFLQHEFAEIQRNRCLEEHWPGGDAIQALVAIAVPLFISAATISRFVADKRFPAQERLKAILKLSNTCASFVSKLDKTYLPIFDQSLLNTDDREREMITAGFQDIVGTVVLLETPLSRLSLSEIIGKSEDHIRCALDPFHSVLDVPNDRDLPIQTFHLSFRDFVLDFQNKKHWFWINAKQTHKIIARRCIDLLSRSLKQDICGLGSPGAQLSDFSSNLIAQKISGAVQYASRYWIHHLRCGEESISKDDTDKVYTFLRENLLHWIEVMSLLQSSSRVIYLVVQLELIMQNRQEAKLSEFCYDVKRFVQFSQSITSKAPLQLYSSALLFLPENSLVRSIFEHKMSSWAAQTSPRQKSWSHVLQTLDFIDTLAYDVAFSPDGKQLVSVGSSRNVRIWDAVSGTLLQTMEHHDDRIFSVAFSPDGKHIASGSMNTFINLWDARSGLLLRTLEGHGEGVTSVKFSPDGRRLASGSFDGTIKLWDAISGLLLQTLESQGGSVLSVAFSPDGKQLASGSINRTITLWDAISGLLLQTLESHAQGVLSVVFSPDGKRVASASNDSAIKLWDAMSGLLLQTLEGHGGPVRSVIFSPDGKQLASASTDGTFKLWDASPRPLYHTKPQFSRLKFSPDGKQLASISVDQAHRNYLSFLIFSPDETKLASGSLDCTFKLWDIASGKLLQNLKGHTKMAIFGTFSPNGKQIVSGSDDSTIKLWDVASGAFLRTVSERSGERPSCVEFLPDGRQLLVGWWAGIVDICDTTSGTIIQTLALYNDGIDNLLGASLSPDGMQLALASSGKPILLWDMPSRTQTGILSFQSSRVCFSKDGQFLKTDRGNFHLDSPSIPSEYPPNLEPSILVQHQWISYNGYRVLQLPHQYRGSYAVLGDKIALSSYEGGVDFFRISSPY
ncbi:hypothetical protein ABW20_dc0102384 [Dactylellina cionopaga]|nr:hypothetical protein ABW20_dc0102384 [Dactylellina cionopaga]